MSGIDRIGPSPAPDDLEPDDATAASDGADPAAAASEDGAAAPPAAPGARTTGPRPPRIDMVAAKATAERLGDFLKSRLEAGGVATMPPENTTLDLARPFFERAFGPALPETRDAGGRTIIGDKFIMKAGNFSGSSPIESLDGHALMRIPSLTPSGAFFYVSTLVDLVTGDVYQEKSKNGGGSGALTIFGPLVPPEDARITGSGYQWSQLMDLAGAVTKRVR